LLSFPRWPVPQSFYFKFPTITKMTDSCHCAQLLVEMVSCKLFAWAALQLWSSISQPPA
jgi:hypothetical protein